MALLAIDFARDNAWLQQMAGGDPITAEEQAAFWRDVLACFALAQTWEATLAAADLRLATLTVENTRLRAALAEAQAPLPS